MFSLNDCTIKAYRSGRKMDQTPTLQFSCRVVKTLAGACSEFFCGCEQGAQNSPSGFCTSCPLGCIALGQVRKIPPRVFAHL